VACLTSIARVSLCCSASIPVGDIQRVTCETPALMVVVSQDKTERRLNDRGTLDKPPAIT